MEKKTVQIPGLAEVSAEFFNARPPMNRKERREKKKRGIKTAAEYRVSFAKITAEIERLKADGEVR